ncbi:aquaporin family protein [Puniceicoccaceae bacterium K14]|nr:aquaporin family protein [Puniceicoccaceae bacterium K14]
MNTTLKWLVGEVIGTFVLVFIGCSTVAVAVTSDGQLSLFHVASVWGFGVTLAILISGQLSNAHLNPAVTLSLATFGDFPWKRVPGYIIAQFIGAFIAAALMYATYNGSIEAYESANDITRGEIGSEASAMTFGEFFPNPGGRPLSEQAPSHITPWNAFLAEFIGTAILMIVIYCVTNPNNSNIPKSFPPIFIGMTIFILISLLAPLSQGGFNPARDLAPRLFSSLVGWGTIPFSANGTGWFSVYVIGPIAGGLCGGALARFAITKGYKSSS